MEILKNYILRFKTFGDKLLRAKNSKYGGYQKGLASMLYKYFDKNTSGSDIKNGNFSNKELTAELHKPIIKNFNKRKVYSPFLDNIWGAYLADMQLISKLNKGFRFLLGVIDFYSNCAWFIPLKDKKRY